MTDNIKPRVDEEWMIEDCGDRIFLGVPRKAADKLDRIITYWDVTDYTEEARSRVLNDANEIVAARRNAALLRECRSVINDILSQKPARLVYWWRDRLRALLERMEQ